MSFLLIFLYVAFFHFSTLIFSNGAGFSKGITEEVIAYSSLDVILSFFVVWFVFKKFTWLKYNAEEVVTNTYIKAFEQNKLVLYLILGFTAFLAFQSFSLIVQGVPRHELMREYETGGMDYMIVSSFFKILVPMVFFFRTSLNLKVIASCGLILSIVITASRSELAYVIKFFMILLLFTNQKTIISKVWKFALVSICMIFFAIMSTSVLQNRPISEGFSAVYDIFINVITYRAYGYYLAEYSMAAANHLDKTFFGFFGYVSEFFVRRFTTPEVPVDSIFVSELHYLGTSEITGRPFLANVIYPWWSWFVGTFGPLGLLLKAAFIGFILYLLLTLRFIFTVVLLLSFVLLGSMSAHPLLTVTHTFNFIITIAIDVLVWQYAKKQSL
jgi:hypothetical protein